jgi:hypothetical protein
MEHSRRPYDAASGIQRNKLCAKIEIDKLSPLDLDAPADGHIERIMLFETDTGDIALALITSAGTMTMELSNRSLRRLGQLALEVAGKGKGHRDVV